jgi:hypothetical protein
MNIKPSDPKNKIIEGFEKSRNDLDSATTIKLYSYTNSDFSCVEINDHFYGKLNSQEIGDFLEWCFDYLPELNRLFIHYPINTIPNISKLKFITINSKYIDVLTSASDNISSVTISDIIDNIEMVPNIIAKILSIFLDVSIYIYVLKHNVEKVVNLLDNQLTLQYSRQTGYYMPYLLKFIPNNIILVKSAGKI